MSLTKVLCCLPMGRILLVVIQWVCVASISIITKDVKWNTHRWNFPPDRSICRPANRNWLLGRWVRIPSPAGWNWKKVGSSQKLSTFLKKRFAGLFITKKLFQLIFFASGNTAGSELWRKKNDALKTFRSKCFWAEIDPKFWLRRQMQKCVTN